MLPICVFIIIVVGFIALWLLLSDSNSNPAVLEYYPRISRKGNYQVPNPQWRYLGKHPTPQDYTAWNYLANRFFPTDRNTNTDTMF